MKPHELDGSRLGDVAGHHYVIFAPRWWQVWRWLSWFRAPARGRVSVCIGGENHSVRCMAVAS